MYLVERQNAGQDSERDDSDPPKFMLLYLFANNFDHHRKNRGQQNNSHGEQLVKHDSTPAIFLSILRGEAKAKLLFFPRGPNVQSFRRRHCRR
jgi:hypothetical protein